MAIKRFGNDGAEQKVEQPSIPKSMFDPFEEPKDHRKSALGERVYTKGQDSKAAMQDANDRLNEAVGDIARVLPDVQELGSLYARMISMPSAATFNAFTKRVSDAAEDSENNKALITMLVSLVAFLQEQLTGRK